MKSVCVVTSTRADYGLLSPLIRRIAADEALELRLVATGTHLSQTYGMTVCELEWDGFTTDARIPILAGGNDEQAVSNTMANALCGFGAYFAKNKSDILVVLGDRYEMCAICAAAVNARIPIAHIHGGETTQGAVDECYRHSITKMSYLHFTACETYRRRVIQLGEDPSRVFHVGALGVENTLHTELIPMNVLAQELAFPALLKPFAVVTFHPVTLEAGTGAAQCEALFSAMDRFPDIGFLCTKANADAGGQEINALLDAYAEKRPNCKAVASLGAQRYLSALNAAAFALGNSSSGIVEAPAFGIPTVNIGDRQKGRLRASSVIDCKPETDDIVSAINQALSSEFRDFAKHASNPYGTGDTSERICETMKRFLYEGRIDLKKRFFDLEYEVDI